MSFTRAQVLTTAQAMVKDSDSQLTSAQWQDFADRIVTGWRPVRKAVSVLTGDSSTYRYTCSVSLSGWIDNRSAIDRIVYPAGYQDKAELPKDDYVIQKTAAGLDELVMLNDAFTSGYTARVWYTIPHTLHATEASSTTMPLADFLPFVYAVCELACLALASYYSEAANSGLGADSVAYVNKSGEFRKLAEQYAGKVKQHVKTQETSGMRGDWDRRYEFSGEQFFFHDRDTR